MMPPTFADWVLLVAPYLTVAGVLRWHFTHRHTNTETGD